MKMPLTHGQHGLWYLSQVDAQASAAYNVVFALEASAALDEHVLGKSLQVVIKRHPLLGARVDTSEGAPQLELEWAPGTSAGHVPVQTATGSLADAALRQSDIPFDFETGPLFRLLITHDPSSGRNGLVLTFAHLVFDGASLPIFLKDLGVAYTAMVQGTEPVLGKAPITQAELVQRERAFIESEEGERQVADIVRRLEGIPSKLALPTGGRSASSRFAYPAGHLDVDVSADLVARINRFCASYRVSSASFYLAVMQTLLWQYSQQDDFGISVPVDTRDCPASQRTIGYLSNLGLVRARLQRRATAAELVMATAEQIVDLLDSREVPFPTVVRQLKLSGQNLQGPLMQVAFNHQYVDKAATELHDIHLLPVRTAATNAKNQFKLDVEETARSVTCRFVFDRDSFTTFVVAQMAEQYKALLQMFVEAPNRRLSDMPMIGATEVRLLGQWNDTRAEFSEDASIHELFELQVGRSPNAVAVSYGDQHLTYAQLNAKANQLARHIKALQVMPETLVAVCLVRGVEMVAALLGILKAGGAYLPIDPAYPAERILHMLEDAAPKVILTQWELLPRLPPFEGHTIFVEPSWWTSERGSTENLPRIASTRQLAYCLYTSGSTGRPKGVALTHRNAVNLLKWAGTAFSPRDMSRLMFSTSICFDLSVFELFAPLSYGGTVLLVQDALALTQGPSAEPVSAVNMVPSAVSSLLDNHALPPGLSVINLAGEPLQRALVNRIASQAPQARVLNLYGPTEYSTYASCCEVQCDEQSRITLGRPVANTQIHVLNSELQPVGIGVAGEICISGEGLARGYLGRPDLTAERFVPNPFGPPGTRMYRTGDLGRYLPDGSIDFLGRMDHQVKIRGFRIELGEIEAALLQHEIVSDTVVVAREDDAGSQQLVAYVVASDPHFASVEHLRSLVQRTLPDYMVPQAWVFMRELPLNANGKIERNALPAPTASRAAFVQPYQAPRTPTQEWLARTWGDMLGLDRVGIHDNFFVLGGHSLLATRIIARIQQEKGQKLPLRAIFDTPTVEGLAAVIETESHASRSTGHADVIPRLARTGQSV